MKAAWLVVCHTCEQEATLLCFLLLWGPCGHEGLMCKGKPRQRVEGIDRASGEPCASKPAGAKALGWVCPEGASGETSAAV